MCACVYVYKKSQKYFHIVTLHSKSTSTSVFNILQGLEHVYIERYVPGIRELLN